MKNYQNLCQQLREFPVLQARVNTMEQALATLTPEERVVANLMLIQPRLNSAQQVCQLLDIERTSAYRIRLRILKKLAVCLGGETGS